jgi:hypothetical protein
MADFRKLLFAFAVVGLLLATGVPVFAQANTNATGAMTCTTFAVPPNVRAEGIAELVGDVVLSCQGGVPAGPGVPIPPAQITASLNTNITSRVVNPTGATTNGSEALLLIDEPFAGGGTQNSAANNPSTAPVPQTPVQPATQRYCAAPAQTNCPTITGVTPTTVSGVLLSQGSVGPYNGSAGRPNVFQGTQTIVNRIDWLGIPLDAPGTVGTRTIRLTNVRANACQLGVSSTLTPTQIFMLITINGSQAITVLQPTVTVAAIVPGLTGSVRTDSSTATTPIFSQCNSVNLTLANGTSTTGTSNILFRAQEGFSSSFKPRGYVVNASGNIIGDSSGANTTSSGAATIPLQNVPGFPYNTESGMVLSASTASENSNTTGLGQSTGRIGVADSGTRIMFSLANVGAGVQVWVPAQITLTIVSGAGPGVAQLVTGTDANGNGGSITSGSALTQVTVSGGSAAVVYEILSSNPSAVERLDVPGVIAFVANPANNLPATGVSTATVSFAPLSTVTTASATAPIPRFCPGTSVTAFSIILCQCNLLFPFVTNQAGFDTGIAIANTSQDPFGTSSQSGPVKLNYYGGTTGGGAAPPAFTTTGNVAAGSELIFTLSGGGGCSPGTGCGTVPATPGFQGYLIAQANFQYCHAFAFITGPGLQIAEGYLAIQLDDPFSVGRTKQNGENKAH